MKDEQEKLRSEASCIHGMPFPGSLQEINQFIINVEFFNAA